MENSFKDHEPEHEEEAFKVNAVFIVTDGYMYDGEEIIAVYATLEEAQKKMYAEAGIVMENMSNRNVGERHIQLGSRHLGIEEWRIGESI